MHKNQLFYSYTVKCLKFTSVLIYIVKIHRNDSL